MSTPSSPRVLPLQDVLRLAEERAAAGHPTVALAVYRDILSSGHPIPTPLRAALRAAAAAPGDASARDRIRIALDPAEWLDGQDTPPAGINIDLISWGIEHLRHKSPLTHAQFGQDLFVLRHVLPDLQGGVFVDIGAYDGVLGSNTWLLERAYGWSGLCLEPDPVRFAALARNRRAVCVRTCVGDRDGTADFLQVDAGLTMMGGLIDSYDEEMLRLVRERSSTSVVSTTIRRLDTLLDEHGITAVDYLSIDVEGAESAILDSFDFAALPVRVVSVENGRALETVRHRMRAAGFLMAARLGVDDVFIADGPHRPELRHAHNSQARYVVEKN